MSERKTYVIVAGDVLHSAGTRSYLREMLNYIQHLSPELYMFQFRLDDRETQQGFIHVDDFPWALRMASNTLLFRMLPRPLYRLFERFILLVFLWQVTGKIKGDDVLVVSGVLDWLHLFRWRLPKETWWLKLGVIEEEGVNTLRYKVRKWIEAKHASFQHRIVVSEPMGLFLDQEYGQVRGQQLVLPCLVDLKRFPTVSDRDMLRQQLALADKFVVAYVGTASHWQCVEETIQIFRLILAEKPNSFLWIFTPDGKTFERLLSDLPKDCWRVEFRPHHELASVLPAADVACLIRRRELLNCVSSPLKFPEYMACGLPVLIGEQVGQYSEIVKMKQLGVMVDPDQPETWQMQLETLFILLEKSDDVRLKCRGVAESLSWQGYGSKLDRIMDVSKVREDGKA